MSGKTKPKPKPETKPQTKLMKAVFKRAALMRAPYRGSSYQTAQIIQTNKNSPLDKKTKEQSSLIAKSQNEKTSEKVGADHFNKYLLLMNITHTF